MKNKMKFVSILGFLYLCISTSAFAQHSHGRRNTVELEYESIPAHDAILTNAPMDMILRFNEYVRLVKLTLKAEDIRTIEIDFQFSNDSSRVFIQELPELDRAAYYTAEWAALNVDNVIVYGFFCFSYGPGARRPTSIIESRVFPSDPFQ